MSKEDSPSARANPARGFTVRAGESIVLKPQSDVLTAVVCVSALLVPGLGHLILKRWTRGALLLASVLLMFVLGLGMQGALYGMPARGELISLGTLNAFANVGVGIPYFLARGSGLCVGIPTSQAFDYGRVFLAVAGLLNYLIVFDAFDIARGRKQ